MSIGRLIDPVRWCHPQKCKAIHPKKWGYELWITNGPLYCGKLLVFENSGGSTSMHFHMQKTETMYLHSGKMQIDLIDPETAEKYSQLLDPGDSILIPRGQSHRLIALEKSELYEFSTTHQDSDSYRVER